jgi:hypothetical protein
MNLFAKLWRDEAGVLLSAEAVVVGTVAVVGLTTGLTVVAKSVNEELQDVAFAIRSLDQSYSIPAIEGCGARTAGSSFQQEPVKKSLAELCEVIEKAEKEEKTQAERMEQQMKKKDKNGEDSKKKKKREENI